MIDDAELITIEAFIIALYQQREPLPEGVSAEIADIAESLETRVIDLHNLAIKTPALTAPYQEASRRLDSQAAERGMGLDRLKFWSESDPQSSGSSTEGDNVTPDARDNIERLEKAVEKIKQKYK